MFHRVRVVPPTRRCWVYQAVDVEGTPIYVGISCDPERRWREHECDKPWAYEVANWETVEEHRSEREARAHETRLIRQLRTRWNIDESPIADEVRARYLSMFGYVPEAKPHRSYVQTLAWPVRLILWLAKVVLVVAWLIVSGLLRLFWVVFSFTFCSLFGIRRRRRRHRRRR